MGIDITVIAPVRTRDSWGEGHFGAARGDHLHMGIDFAAAEHSVLISPINGHVTKLGYPYADDLTYRYVQVTDLHGRNHRFFYVHPDVEPGERVDRGYTELGTVQNITKRYPVPRGMMNHFHYEIKDKDGNILPPEEIWAF